MEFDRKTVSHGAIPVGKIMPLSAQFVATAYNTTPPAPGLEWGTLAAGTDGYVLTCSAAAAEGVAWAAPVTGTGASTQAANIVLAGPATGAAAAPTFRAIVNADLPASGRGSGTVTSVTFTGDGTVLSSTPSTAVTATGTLTGALATQAANIILAGPTTGSAVAPTFRALVSADLPASPSITGLTLSGALSVASAIYVIDTYGHVVTAGSTPTYTAGVCSGTSPTISVTGNDTCGVISVTPGSSPSVGSDLVVTVNFANAMSAAPHCVSIFPVNYAAYTAMTTFMIYSHSNSWTVNGFGVRNDKSAALVQSTQYMWGYKVNG